MKLVVIIPALNEEKTIGDVIAAVPTEIDGMDQIEVVVIDDCSSDQTKMIAESAGALVIPHCENKGVGAAFHTGMKAALKKGADVIVNIDGDGQHNPGDIPALLRPVLDGKADFSTASRFKEPSLIPRMPGIKLWGNKMMSRLISYLTGKKFYDVSCGFRAYTRDTALRLTLVGKFTYTQETFLDLAFKGLSIAEIPLAVKKEREFGESRVASNLWKYGFRTSKIIFRAFRDYKPLRFFGFISLPFLTLGTLLLTFLLIHYIASGQFSPHKWAGFSGLGSIILGLIFFILGLVADMLDRIRLNQEELLYYKRKEEYNHLDQKQEQGSSSVLAKEGLEQSKVNYIEDSKAEVTNIESRAQKSGASF
jgi:glycosyltransferase involved in cell wall biosynthesis